MSSRFLRLKALSLLLAAASLTACAAPAVSETAAAANPEESPPTTELATYDASDVDLDWADEHPTYVVLKGDSVAVTGTGAGVSGNTIMLVSSGAYVFTGKLNNGQIIVDAQNKGTVRLVLNGAELYRNEGTVIHIKNADKAIITLADGTENLVSDGESYPDEADEDAPNAAIFSKDDLTVNGSGTLTVRGNYNNGIASRDALRITGGTLTVHAVDDALMGRDAVAMKAGHVTIEAGGDGVKATNDTDDSKGSISLEGGSLTIQAGMDGIQAASFITVAGGEIAIAAEDDGVHADKAITIQGGMIDVTKSREGIESELITISGGETHVVASDDGVNIAGGNEEAAASGGPGQFRPPAVGDGTLQIDGGTVTVDSMGDGVDVNGSIAMTGGTLLVDGPTSNNNAALDYDGTFELTGGTVVAAGSAGMAQAPSEESSQRSVMMSFSTVQEAGTLVTLTDSSGQELLTFAPKRQFQSIVFASPALKEGGTYTLHAGGTETVQFSISNAVTWLTEEGVSSAPIRRPGGGGRP